MAIDKEYWKQLFFEKNNFPDIVCSTCEKGFLKPLKETFKIEETSLSKIARDHDNWDPMWICYRFFILLKCSRERCLDITMCIGEGTTEPETEYDPITNSSRYIYKQHYKPLYFIPPLKIIPTNDKYPKKIKSGLDNSFSHFFSDLPACANRIRVCIELLMNELRVKKTEVKKGKRTGLTLHQRILEYKKINPEVSDYLLAIKWIGNSGSHHDESLTKDDILDAYSLLEFSLHKLYENNKSLIKLTKKINKRRAPVSKRRRGKT